MDVNTESRGKLSIHCIKALDYISEHLNTPPTVSEIAMHLHLDRTYFSKLFKKETGQTVTEYIGEQKIKTAQNMLLYSEMSCADIASYLGFASHSHFTEHFKAHTGCTPSSYREREYRKHFSSTHANSKREPE